MRTNNGSRGPVLLDTHTWVWLAEGTAQRLSKRCLAAIRRARFENRIWVAAISVWEIAMLESKGRLDLSKDLLAWVEYELNVPGIHFAGLEPEIAIASTRLPGEVHGDPADRILIATARRLGATLVTRDAAILDYGKLRHVKVLDAGA